MNPLAALKLKNIFAVLCENHPKVPLFFKAASGMLDVGSVVELSITTSEGKRIVTNVKVTESDMEQLAELKGIAGK